MVKARPTRVWHAHVRCDGVTNCSSTALVKFSGEEGYGRFVDMHELHTVFINLKGMQVSQLSGEWRMSSFVLKKLEYLDYLGKFDHLFDIPRQLKTPAYKRCVHLLIGICHTTINGAAGTLSSWLSISRRSTSARTP